MSPESITKQEYSIKSDVFSFGVVVWEILTVSEPYPVSSRLLNLFLAHHFKQEMNAIETAIKVTTEGLRLAIPEYADPVLANVMKKCWLPRPEDRPDMKKICEELGALSKQDAIAEAYYITPPSSTTHTMSSETSTPYDRFRSDPNAPKQYASL